MDFVNQIKGYEPLAHLNVLVRPTDNDNKDFVDNLNVSQDEFYTPPGFVNTAISFSDSISNYIAALPGNLEKGFVDALQWVANLAHDATLGLIGLGGTVAGWIGGEGYHAWLHDYKCETHALYLDLKYNNQRLDGVAKLKQSESVGDDLLVSRKGLLEFLNKLSEKFPNAHITRAIAIVEANINIPCTEEECGDVSMAIELAERDFKKQLEESNAAYAKRLQELCETDELSQNQEDLNVPLIDKNSRADHDPDLKTLAQKMQRQQSLLKLLEGLNLTLKLASAHLSRAASLPHIIDINKIRNNQGYKHTTSYGASIGLKAGASAGVVDVLSGFIRLLYNKILTKVVDDEGYYGELDLHQIGGSVGIEAIKLKLKEDLALGVEFSAAATCTTADGIYHEWADQRNNAVQRFSEHMKDHRHDPNIEPHLSRRDAWKPEGLRASFQDDVKNVGAESAIGNLFKKIDLGWRKFILDALAGYESLAIGELTAQYAIKKTKENRETGLITLATGLDHDIFSGEYINAKNLDDMASARESLENVEDGQSQLKQLEEIKKLQKLTLLEAMADIEIAQVKSVRDKEMERIKNSTVSQKGLNLRRCVYFSESRIQTIEKNLSIDQLKVNLDDPEGISDDFIKRKNRIEEIHLKQKLQLIEKYLIKHIKAIEQSPSKEEEIKKKILGRCVDGCGREKEAVISRCNEECNSLTIELEKSQNKLSDMKKSGLHSRVANVEEKSTEEIAKLINHLKSKIAAQKTRPTNFISFGLDEEEDGLSLQETDLPFLEAILEIRRVSNRKLYIEAQAKLECSELDNTLNLERAWVEKTLAISQLKRSCENKIDEEINTELTQRITLIEQDVEERLALLPQELANLGPEEKELIESEKEQIEEEGLARKNHITAMGLNPIEGRAIESKWHAAYQEEIDAEDEHFRAWLIDAGYAVAAEDICTNWEPKSKTKAPIEFTPLPVENLNHGVFEAKAHLFTAHVGAVAKANFLGTGFGLGLELDGGYDHFQLLYKRHTPLIKGMADPQKPEEQKKAIQEGTKKQFGVIGATIMNGWKEETTQVKLTPSGDQVLAHLGILRNEIESNVKKGESRVDATRQCKDTFRNFLEQNNFQEFQITNLLTLLEITSTSADQVAIFKNNGLLVDVQATSFDIKTCYSYLEKDFTFYEDLKGRLAALGKHSEQSEEGKNITKLLDKLFTSYGANNEDDFRTHLLYFNAHMFALVAIDKASSYAQVRLPNELVVDDQDDVLERSTNSETTAESEESGLNRSQQISYRVDEEVPEVAHFRNPLVKKMQELEGRVLATMSDEAQKFSKYRESVDYETKDWKFKGELKAAHGWAINLGVGLRAEVMVRERFHTNALRSGQYIDVVIAGSGSIGLNEIAAITKALSENPQTAEFSDTFATYFRDMNPMSPLVQTSGEVSMQMRWFKSKELEQVAQKSGQQLGYSQIFTRVMANKGFLAPISGAALNLPEVYQQIKNAITGVEVPIPAIPCFLSLTAGVNFSTSGTTCEWEWYNGDSTQYYALRFAHDCAVGLIDPKTGEIKADSYWRTIEEEQKKGLTALFSNLGKEKIAADPKLKKVKAVCSSIDSMLNDEDEKAKRIKAKQLLTEEHQLLSDAKDSLDAYLESDNKFKLTLDRHNLILQSALKKMKNRLKPDNDFSKENLQKVNQLGQKITKQCETIKALLKPYKTKEVIPHVDKILDIAKKIAIVCQEKAPTQLLLEIETIRASVIDNKILNLNDETENVKAHKSNRGEFNYATDRFIQAAVIYELEYKITQLNKKKNDLINERDRFIGGSADYNNVDLKIDAIDEVLLEADMELKNLKPKLPISIRNNNEVGPCLQSFRDFLAAYFPHCNERKANSDRYRDDGKQAAMFDLQTKEWYTVRDARIGV